MTRQQQDALLAERGISSCDGDMSLSWCGPDVTSGKGARDENFPVGTLLIARRYRGHIMSYYNFARCIDDIADSPALPEAQKVARLKAMDAILDGAPPPPGRQDAATAAVLHAHYNQLSVPRNTASDLITAFIQDTAKNRYANWAELMDYCRFSANPVGRFLLLLHGENAATLPASDALCTSLQVINHLQDVKQDLLNLNRSYLPQDWLAAEGVTPEDVTLSHASPGLRRVFDRMLDEVDALNREALRLPGMIRDRRMRFYTAVIVALAIRLTQRLRREDPVAGRVALRRADVLHACVSAGRTLISRS